MRKAVWITLLWFAVFPAQGAGIYFEDVGSQTGTHVFRNVHGTGFFDYNGDGWDDLYVVSNLSEADVNKYFIYGYLTDILMRNDHGIRFLDASAYANVWGDPAANVSDQGVAAADYDNDGDMDFCNANGMGGGVLLYNNDGYGRMSIYGPFLAYPSQDPSGTSRGMKPRNITFMDYNNDGYVDVFFGSDHNLKMFRNNGYGRFNIDNNTGLDSFHDTGNYIHGFAIGDVNNDGYLDIFLTSFTDPAFLERGSLSALFINDGSSNPGQFTRVTTDCGINMSVDYAGAVFFDYNNDGWLDLLVNVKNIYRGPRLYRNNGDGTFTNVEVDVGLSASHVYESYFGCGFTIADFDNDGYQDIFAAADNGLNNRIFRNKGDGSNIYLDESYASGVVYEHAGCWPCPVADFDRDGFVDIFLNGNRYEGPKIETTLLRNNSQSWNSWLQVRLEGVQSNRSGIGARLNLYCANLKNAEGKPMCQTRQVIGGQGYQCNSFTVAFGVKRETLVDSLVINWPSGIRQKLVNLPVNVIMDVTEEDNSSQYLNHTISGEVSYAFDSGTKISDVRLVKTGTARDSVYSGSDGLFSLRNIPRHDSVLVTPRKSATGITGITAQDAAMTARGIAGLETLSAYQLISADADESGHVNALDAVLIARAAVGLPAIAGSLAGIWRFSPDSVSYPDIDENKTGVNFQAFPIGDVDGDWATASLAKTAFWIPAPDTLAADSSGEIVIPVRIESDQQCLSADFQLAFNPKDLEFVDAIPAGHPSPSSLVTNAEPGSVRLALWRTTYLEGPSDLLELRFRIKSPLPTVLTWERILLNGRPVAQRETFIQSSINDQHIGPPSDLHLDGNYPNPFNGGTVIHYQVPQGMAAELAVFDVSGRKIVLLGQDFRGNGDRQLFWDGRDETGMDCPSGVYFCRLQAGNRVVVGKMIKMK